LPIISAMSSRPDDHFSSIADAYARGRFGYPAALFDFLRDLCPTHDLAWDCATGSGQAVHPLAERFRQVIATDISDELLRRAPGLPQVSYVVAPAERSPLATHSADLVTVAQALHWFDLAAFWPEVCRVLKPGGVVAFWGYNWPVVNAGIDTLLLDLRTTLAPYWPARSALLHAEYTGVTPPFRPLPSPAFVATARWTRADYLAHLASWSAVRYCRERSGQDPLADFAPRLQTLWPDDTQHLTRWPLAFRAFRV
jgi:ubiquinone/menaquinone biosynthesis C-methylase UbiE